MSTKTQNIRLTLGPVAQDLLDQSGGKNGRDLDRLLTGLLERPETNNSDSPNLKPLEARIEALEDVIRSQGDRFALLQEVVILEQRMTRIFVASILSDDSEEQHQIMEMAAAAVEGLIDESGLISERERETLKSREHEADAAMQRELDRGSLIAEQDKDPELEH
ncbi:hypothetical protein ABLN87_20880 [Ruegeria sp. SCPT10]|uniref:hypothetical protein n=1 Tax=Ruegeria sp. SCP10 TaxID=3141377 RepID=UPI00333A0DC7